LLAKSLTKALSFSTDSAELLTRQQDYGIPSVEQFIALDMPNHSAHQTVVGCTDTTAGVIAAAASQMCFRFDPVRLVTLMSTEPYTHTFLTPSMVRMLRAEYDRDPEQCANN